MNKIGKGPTLTWVFIALAVALTVLTLSMSSYDTFLSENNGSISSDYSGVYENLSDSSNTLFGYKADLTDESLINKIWDGVGGITNVFITGLTSIGTFFGMITLTTKLFGTMQSVIPNFTALIGLLILISSVYIAMSLIKARRGSTDIA